MYTPLVIVLVISRKRKNQFFLLWPRYENFISVQTGILALATIGFTTHVNRTYQLQKHNQMRKGKSALGMERFPEHG